MHCGQGGEADGGGRNENDGEHGEHGEHGERGQQGNHGRHDGPGAGGGPTGWTARGPAGWRGRGAESAAGIERAASGYTGAGTEGAAAGRRADRRGAAGPGTRRVEGAGQGVNTWRRRSDVCRLTG